MKAESIPVLTFGFVNLDQLAHSLETIEQYSGMVFTSQRSVEAVRLATADYCVSMLGLLTKPASILFLTSNYFYE